MGKKPNCEILEESCVLFLHLFLLKEVGEGGEFCLTPIKGLS